MWRCHRGVLRLCGENKHKMRELRNKKKVKKEINPSAHCSLLGSSPQQLCWLPLPCSPAWCPLWLQEPSEGFWSPESDEMDGLTSCALLLLTSVCTTHTHQTSMRMHYSDYALAIYLVVLCKSNIMYTQQELQRRMKWNFGNDGKKVRQDDKLQIVSFMKW